MGVGSGEAVELDGPEPFLAVRLRIEAEERGLVRFAFRMGRIVGQVERGQVIHAVRERQRPGGTAGCVFIAAPFQADTGLEGIGGGPAEPAGAPLALRPADRQGLEKVLVHVRDDPVDHLRLGRPCIGVILQRQAVVDEGDVAVELDPLVIDIGPDAEEFDLDLVEGIFIHLVPDDVEFVQDHVDAACRLVDARIGLLDLAGIGRDDGLGIVGPVAQDGAGAADVRQLVHPAVREGLVLLDVVGKVLIAGEKAGDGFFLAGREGSARRACQGITVQAAAPEKERRGKQEGKKILFHIRRGFRR